ncbi:DUF159-domain-containing protein [Cystobasidium minutum MCA 4210]|uniref:DUF159-domain-containing protein n=1 Tax=Cystobasidium minutum MCA 4210 TaxID=1397322 RepID=UPI0034D010A0|eukprot:jgi/Rhomi1/198614/gm1.6828_g
MSTRRYALSLPAGAVRMHIENELERPVAAWEDEEDYNPSRGYNIAPRTRNPIILRGGASRDDAVEPQDGEDSEKQGDKKKESEPVLRMENMQWGLIPHWMKRAPDTGSMLKTINAREDTINEGGSMWKSIRGRKRCIVVAEGFYEWLHKGSERIPHYIKRKDGKLMCLAGLWDSVTYEGEKKPLHTYTIVTVDANKQMTFLHNRMPAILPDAQSIATWLDTTDGTWSSKTSSLLKPFEGELEMYDCPSQGLLQRRQADCQQSLRPNSYPVPKEVGKVGTQSSDYLRPVSERKGNIASFFAKQSTKKEDKKEKTSSPEAKKKELSPNDTQAEEFAKDVEYKEEETATKAARPKIHSPSDKTASSPEIIPGPAKNDKAASEGSSASRRGKQEADQTNLPLNPDEGDEIAEIGKPKSGNSKGKGKAIVLDGESKDEAGDSKKDPILLDDIKSSSDAESTHGSTKRKRQGQAKKPSGAAETPAPKRKRPASPVRSSKSTKGSKKTSASKSGKSTSGKKPATDNEGNEKLENFFEIEDDSS